MNSHNINAAWLEELTADINMEQTLQNFSTQIDSMLTNVLCDMESVRKEQKIMQEKLLYLQVKSELKAAKSGKKP